LIDLLGKVAGIVASMFRLK